MTQTRGRRFELPPGLDPHEERAILLALEQYFGEGSPRPSGWALGGRLDAIGMGALQTRGVLPGAWQRAARGPFARRGNPTLFGRGDAK